MTKWGTSNVTCPTAPPLPRAINRVQPLFAEDRRPTHPRLSCHAAPARSRRATSIPSAILALPSHHQPCGIAVATGEPDGVSNRTSCHSGWTVFAFCNVRAHSPVPATNNCRSRRGPRRPAPARATPPKWARRWSTPAWSAGCARPRARRPGAHALISSSLAPHVYIHGRNCIRYSATAPTTAIKTREPWSLLAHTPRLGTTHTWTKGRRSLR